LSLLLRPDEALREAGQWALLAGLALAEALDAEPGGRFALKWPNDLLCDGAKLGGILVDAEAGAGGRLAWLVIGIGVNLAQAPDVEGRAVASLEGAIAPETLAWRIMERVSALCDLRRTSGFAPIRAAWTRLALPAGTAMTVKLAGGEVAGRFVGLNEAGNLLLATPDGGTRAIVAGEVWTPGAKEALTC
jgi:BirA family biotin operon repressor/biotin-[acetyl-CoA-carboxylase] ligase